MSARCAAVLPTGEVCEKPRSASIHVQALAGDDWHAYEDPSQIGLRGPSAGRKAYLESERHQAAYAEVEGAGCAAAAAGAPVACAGPLTAHHTAPRSLVGGLKAADGYPVIVACARHNTWFQEEGREWATTHYVTVNGRDWPFLVTNAWLQAEREARR